MTLAVAEKIGNCHGYVHANSSYSVSMQPKSSVLFPRLFTLILRPMRLLSLLLLTTWTCYVSAQCTAKLTVKAQPRVVLDFDGDGLSDVVTALFLKGETGFLVFKSSDQTLNTASVDSFGQPAPGDYDGDGVWDIATVGESKDRAEWRIKLSSTGEIVKRSFGMEPDRVLTGCRFISSSKNSLAYVKNQKLFATEIGLDEARQIPFAKVSPGQLLGCGDVDGNGIDEPILRSQSRNSNLDALATAGCKGEVLRYKNIRPFSNKGIVQMGTDDFPLVIAARPASRRNAVISLESVSEVFAYPKFNVTAVSKFSSGLFKVGENETSYGVVWQERRDSEIKRRLFSKGPSKAELVSGGLTGTLVAPQEVYTFRELK